MDIGGVRQVKHICFSHCELTDRPRIADRTFLMLRRLRRTEMRGTKKHRLLFGNHLQEKYGHSVAFKEIIDKH